MKVTKKRSYSPPLFMVKGSCRKSSNCPNLQFSTNGKWGQEDPQPVFDAIAILAAIAIHKCANGIRELTDELSWISDSTGSRNVGMPQCGHLQGRIKCEQHDI